MHKTLTWLVPLVALLALITAGTGLFALGGQGPYTFETVYGHSKKIYGHGIYQHDSLLVGAGFRGTDVVILFISLPMLVILYLLARRDFQDTLLAMTGVLLYFLYNEASMTFAATFNAKFLVYTALFSASFFAVMVSLTSLDTGALATRVQPGFPHRIMAILMEV